MKTLMKLIIVLTTVSIMSTASGKNKVFAVNNSQVSAIANVNNYIRGKNKLRGYKCTQGHNGRYHCLVKYLRVKPTGRQLRYAKVTVSKSGVIKLHFTTPASTFKKWRDCLVNAPQGTARFRCPMPN